VTVDTLPPEDVIERFELDRASIAPLTGGHINLSFAASRRDGEACVLQRVNPIFPAVVNEDIDAVTRHLAAKGLITPRLLATREDARWIDSDGGRWRLLTRIEGTTHEALGSADEAAEAGRVLGEFHAALADFDRPLRNERAGVHDLPRHLDALRRALACHDAHPAHAAVAALASRLLALAAKLAPLPTAPRRLVHGDPKISNMIFTGPRAVCLVDLDTLAYGPVAVELGDALRSWCNPESEDSPTAHFSVERAQRALTAYTRATAGLIEAAEREPVPAATLAIAVELSARFAADALNESYFGWDRRRFASASAHNLARAEAQLALAQSIAAALPDLVGIVMTRP
jgi:Ser/Thr protein kinase RdoA (MazF antagonist)